MIIDVTIPTPGESISEVDLASWLVADGDVVKKDQEIAEIESDKATLPLIAEKGGKVKILVSEGETVKVGTVACTIDTSVESSDEKDVAATKESRQNGKEGKTEKPANVKKEASKPASEAKKPAPEPDETHEDVKVTPVARKMMEAEGLSVDDILKGLKKITSKEVNMVAGNQQVHPVAEKSGPASRDINRESLSQLRKKLAKRLVSVKNETAMLTTFNEVDMSEVIRIRKQYQKQFTDAHDVKLGFMSFFVKAVTEALKVYPKVNSMLDGDEMLVPDFVDISIAVQTDKGLMVPVLRNTETMGLADIEKNIIDLATKARKFRLSIDEMTGGTFSITNGGIFGSMLSTPIINPPQSGILGMHNIVERPVAINGKVEIRPIMYVALSYDHRIIDGRDSVSFLVKVKELIEEPHKMLFEGKDPEGMLLGL